MLPRTLRLVPAARKVLMANKPAPIYISKFMAHHGPPADYKFPTIDDLPVPCGSWKEDYDNKQRKYLIHLILGTGFFIITMAVGVTTGSFDLYITAPQKPSPPIKY